MTFSSAPKLNDTGSVSEQTPLLRQRSLRQQDLGLWGRALENSKLLGGEAWSFLNSRTGRGVLKCSLAYLLGSLATFVPFLASILGQQDGKHMVATITVYFHPARSRGSMFEAILMAGLAFAYAVFISFTSMGVSILFGQKFDLLFVGHIIVLIVFCGGGLGFVGWVKQRLGNPLVNIACSLTSLATITVLTKEGAVQAALFSDDKIGQVLRMIVMGVLMTTAVSFSISPVSARQELRENMVQVTDSFADMLTMVTRSFLTGTEEELVQNQFQNSSNKYRTGLTSLSMNLREAKFEHYVMGTEQEYFLEAKLVNCMQLLAQNIGGLRSAATTQFLLLSQPTAGGAATPMSSNYSPQIDRPFSPMDDILLSSPTENLGSLGPIDELIEGEENPEETMKRRQRGLDGGISPTPNRPAEIFPRFILHLGPSMVSRATLQKNEYSIDPTIEVTCCYFKANSR